MPTERDNLDEWLQLVTNVAYQRSQTGDTAGLARLIIKFSSLYKSYPEDPERSSIESATMNCVLMVAASHATVLEFDQALDQCESVFNLIEENRARFIALGKNPRPNSLVWCELLSNLASIKWKAPARFENVLMTPDQMLEKYIECDTRIHAYLAENPYKEERRNENSFRQALNCGIAIGRLALRYLPDQLPRLLNFIKENHGPVLEDSEQTYFWNLAIAQLWCSKKPDRELLVDCFEQYERAIETNLGGNPYISAIQNSFQIEKDYLLHNSPQN